MNMHNPSEMRGEALAQALRTFADNASGDAAIGRTRPHVPLDNFELYHRARQARSKYLRELASAALQAVADSVRQMITRWKRHQDARATYRALRALDSHLLRDQSVQSIRTQRAARGNSGFHRD